MRCEEVDSGSTEIGWSRYTLSLTTGHCSEARRYPRSVAEIQLHSPANAELRGVFAALH